LVSEARFSTILRHTNIGTNKVARLGWHAAIRGGKNNPCQSRSSCGFWHGAGWSETTL